MYPPAPPAPPYSPPLPPPPITKYSTVIELVAKDRAPEYFGVTFSEDSPVFKKQCILYPPAVYTTSPPDIST
jgi:hypothetical protein